MYQDETEIKEEEIKECLKYISDEIEKIKYHLRLATK